MKKAHISAISSEYERWLLLQTATAVDKVRELFCPELIRPTTPVGRLDQSHLTWVVSAAIHGWLSVRAEEATREGLDVERAARVTHFAVDPWDLGSVKQILPKLARSCRGFDWSKPARDWSRDELAEFLLAGFNLIRKAHAARDAVETQLAGKPVNPDVAARQANRAAGNPAMTVAELKQLNDGLIL
jgi:hypothetical protein